MPAAQRSDATARTIGLALLAAAVFVGVLVSACVRTDDQNHDGRPDVWRSYNRFGEVVTIARDTNFDGRSDVEEFYEGGALVRRESDRDFNDRVDLIQSFDPVSREVVRTVTDLNSDGVADLLFLFRDGQPVYAKPAVHAVRSTNAHTVDRAASAGHPRRGHQPLLPLDDPFSGDLAFASVRLVDAPVDLLGPSSLYALPELRGQPERLESSSRIACSSPLDCPSAPSDSASPRGPPVSRS